MATTLVQLLRDRVIGLFGVAVAQGREECPVERLDGNCEVPEESLSKTLSP